MAVDAWSQTLLPAHLSAVAQCWNEALCKAPIVERVRLVNFLLHLRAHFPRWRGIGYYYHRFLCTKIMDSPNMGDDHGNFTRE